MRASHHKQQRTSDRRGLGAALCVGGCDRSSPAAHDKAQGGLHSLPVGGFRSYRGSSPQLLSAAPYTCRGLHCATAFSILSRAHLSPRVAAPRRHVCILPNGRAATHSYAARGGRIGELRYAARLPAPVCRCALARGPQFCLPEHSTRQCSDALEGHFSTSLSGLSFQHRNDDTPERPKSWKRQPIRTAP